MFLDLTCVFKCKEIENKEISTKKFKKDTDFLKNKIRLRNLDPETEVKNLKVNLDQY